jgi:hypothetical protein
MGNTHKKLAKFIYYHGGFIMVDGYQLLANAVVEQAAKDYRQALVEQYELRLSATNREREQADRAVRDLERWFAGDVIKIYTTLDGVDLMQAIKAEVIKFNYDLKALYESHSSR